jgi:hypothetical protein
VLVASINVQDFVSVGVHRGCNAVIRVPPSLVARLLFIQSNSGR